jgi:hypothetical protein
MPMKTATVLAAIIVAVMPLSNAVARTKLSQVFTYDMLNAQVPYLEHLIGPAMHVIALANGTSLRDYQVDGCRVNAKISSQSGSPAVQALSLNLSPRCNIELSAFHLAPLSTRGLTISKIPDWSSLGFESDCISLCGNAADPTVDFIQQSSHATNWIGVVYTITIVSDPSLDAIEKLREFIQKREGEDYVINTKFNCDHRYDRQALESFANVSVNKITIGIFPSDPGERCQ